MENAISLFLNLSFLMACLGIAAFTFVCRKVIEFIIDNPNIPLSKYSKFWRDLFLPILPIIVGGICGYIFKSYSYPDGFDGTGSRISFGLVAGLCSGFFYRMFKAFFTKQEKTLLSETPDIAKSDEKEPE